MRHRGPLATDDQIACERRALMLFASPELRLIRPRLRRILEDDPAGATFDGAAQIDHALDLWIMALLMWKVGGDTANPVVLWHVENTPHRWFGHEMPGMGAAGDNPDHIYRGAFLDGASSYVLECRRGTPPTAQLSFEIFHGAPGKTFRTTQTSKTPDLGNQVALISSDTMAIAPDGSFTVTTGPDERPGDPNHLRTLPGPMQLAVRDVLSDWTQEPSFVTIRRTGGPDLPPAPDDAALLADALADLPDFVAFWSSFKTGWLGGIEDNRYAGPAPRAGGWGYLLGGRFNLADNQAIVLTIADANAAYIGCQLLSPWLMMPIDARAGTHSLNGAQVARNPDGTITYVLARSDPGVANWIDTAGLRQGMFIVRWQGVPPGADAADMVRDFRVIDLAKLDRMIDPAVPRIDAAGRIAQVGQRVHDFDTRLGSPIV